MEVIEKSKKSKKKRHRSHDDAKLDRSLETLYAENINLIEKLKERSASVDDIKKDEFVQTDPSDSIESIELLKEKDEQIKSLTERLQQVTSKLYESKNAYTFLKQDFNKAQKLLSSEVGEYVTVAELSNQPGGWRGRAEQIQQLQQKVSELQLKLNNSENGSRRQSLERRSASSVRLFDKERKQQIENLTKELKEAEAESEKKKKRIEAAKARIAVLESDLNTSKKTIALLNEKTTHDNQLIEALHEQIRQAELKFQNRELGIRKQNEKTERDFILLKSDLEAAHIHMQNYRRQLDEKEKEVETLKSRNGISTSACSSRVAQPSSGPSSSPRSGDGKDANEYIAIGIAAEAERERLLELVTVLNRRLDKDRTEYEQLNNSFKKERCRAAKLETRLQKLELERVGLSKINTGSYRAKAPKLVVSSGNELADPEELRLKFELLQEECLTLKTRLATIQKEKASDLVAFKKMLEQTRKIFKDAYRGKLPAIGCNSSVTI